MLQTVTQKADGPTDEGRAKAAECAAMVGPARLSICIDGLEVMRSPVWALMAVETLRFQPPRRVVSRLKPGTVYDCALTLPDGRVVRFREQMPELQEVTP